eukprot:scaffold8454_cov113-Skeletonema_marinoi.AAC.5
MQDPLVRNARATCLTDHGLGCTSGEHQAIKQAQANVDAIYKPTDRDDRCVFTLAYYLRSSRHTQHSKK